MRAVACSQASSIKKKNAKNFCVMEIEEWQEKGKAWDR